MDEPLSPFFEGEYNRFMHGLDGLSGVEKPRTKAALRRDAENAARPRVLAIPGWDDTIHLGPRLAITKEQATEYWRATRRGFNPNLAPEIIAEMQRRAARLDAMGRSPQSKYSQSWGQVMTATDNVQDLASALSVFGRLALSVGPRIGLRAIPGLGAMVLASDVLNAVMLLGSIAFPAWLGICAGLAAGTRAAAATALTAAVFKGAIGGMTRTGGKSMGWLIRGPNWTQKIAAGIAIGLVTGQVTDSLFGYGISLGPIVGYTMGAAYSVELLARGEPVEIRRSPSAEHFHPRVREKLADVPTSALYDRVNAADVWAHAGLILDAASPASDQERLLAVAVLPAAAALLWQDWKDTGWQDDGERLAGWRPETVKRTIEDVGWQDFLQPGRPQPPQDWPIEWGGRQYDPGAAANDAPGAISAGLDALAARLHGESEPAFVGASTVEAANNLWRLLLPEGSELRPALEPGWLALERMAALGLVPTPPDSIEQFQTFWNAVLHRVDVSASGMKTDAEWSQLAARFGIGLVHLQSPTSASSS